MKSLLKSTLMPLLICLLVLMPIPTFVQTVKAMPVQQQNIQQPLASAARTSSGTTDWVQVNNADQLVAYLTVTARTGGTLDVKLQESPDASTPFDLPGTTFTQVSSSTSSQTVNSTRPFAKWIRVKYDISGGGGFTFHVEYFAYKGNPIVVSSFDSNAANLTAGTLPNARVVALPAANLAEDAIRTASVTVATASVLTLNGTPVTLVAAPGAGKIVLIEEITAKLVFNSVAYTGSNALEFRYTNGSGAKVTADLAAAFINSASGTNYATVKSVVTALTPVANAAVVVFVPTANPAAGNSDIIFTLKYRIVTP